jgi:hypothetical protein
MVKLFKENDWVAAYDFEPMPDRKDAYVAGIITEVKESTYVIKVKKDTMFPEGSRTVVEAPKQDKMLWDFEDRIREWPFKAVSDNNELMRRGYNDEV